MAKKVMPKAQSRRYRLSSWPKHMMAVGISQGRNMQKATTIFCVHRSSSSEMYAVWCTQPDRRLIWSGYSKDPSTRSSTMYTMK